MNIIWLTPEIPYPPIGGRNGVYNRIVNLSKENSIYLFSVAYNEEEEKSCYEMEKICKEVHYYNRNKKRWNVIFKTLILPYSVASRTIPELKKDIEECIAEKKVDVIIVDFPNMAKNVFGLSQKCYYTLNQHNTEYERMREMYKIKTLSFPKRIAYLLESYRLERYEKRIYQSGIFSSITFFSIEDCDKFSNKWKECDAELKVFPLGANAVNLQHNCVDYEHNTMLFVGRLDEVATTNVEAIVWFCEDVLPLIEKEIDVKVVIAGANPCKYVLALQKENVEIIPNYKDLDSVYKLADFVILPLLSGGGVKGKLLEAAAYRKTIISTRHGIEGTEFIPDMHVYYADTSVEFAEMCIEAIKNSEKSMSMALEALDLFEKKYEWKKICDEYDLFLCDSSKGNEK